MVRPVLGGMRIDPHAANRIGCEIAAGRWIWRVMMNVGVGHRRLRTLNIDDPSCKPSHRWKVKGARPMQIGEAAAQSGVSAKMIRYYEEIGLVPRSARQPQGYREYDDRDVHRLRFVARARDLGFSIKEIAELLRLYSDRRRSSADVKRIALRHVAELETKIRAMRQLKHTIQQLADRCHGDQRPDCPILDDLAR